MITCMKLATVKQGTTGLFRYASGLFSKCDCTLVSHVPQREGMQGCTRSVPAIWWPLGFTLRTMSLFSPVFWLCACIWMGRCRCSCAHMHRSEEEVGETRPLTGQEAAAFWLGWLASQLLGSGYLTVLKLQAHEVVPSFFFKFYL